jgi:hypothetical protein
LETQLSRPKVGSIAADFPLPSHGETKENGGKYPKKAQDEFQGRRNPKRNHRVGDDSASKTTTDKNRTDSGGDRAQLGGPAPSMWMFGRALQRLLLRARLGYSSTTRNGIVILDNAERLLTISRNSSSNILAQLLLLPRTLQLPLTVVVISKCILLPHAGAYSNCCKIASLVALLCIVLTGNNWQVSTMFRRREQYLLAFAPSSYIFQPTKISTTSRMYVPFI